MTLVLLIIFISLLLFYLRFLYRIYTGLNNLSASSGSIPTDFISVIIPFRNESENILNSLRSLEAQNYPEHKYEIIYVDDSSTDNSLHIICGNRKKNNIKTLILPASFGEGKKKALQFGIDNSIGDIIVTTDADCVHNTDWLISLLKNFDNNTAMVAGAIEFTNGQSFFDNAQRLEFAGLITAGAGLIGARTPYICNAANLAYRKKVFYELKGFNDNSHLASGDDEFLMQKISKETNYQIKFSIDKNSIVKTNGNKTLSEFINQRKRWASKGLFYKDPVKVISLVLIFLFYLALLLQGILSFFSYFFLISFLLSLTAKIFSEYIIMSKAADTLFTRDILRYFFVTELLQIPYLIIVSIMGTFGSFKWKNRVLIR